MDFDIIDFYFDLGDATFHIDKIVCYRCGLSYFSELAYQFRKEIHDQLPADVIGRMDCYWGRNCRTQTHSLHHAR